MTQAMAELPPFARVRYEPGKRAAWIMAVAVHLLLAMFLIYGVRWQTSAPEAVSVDLVRYVPPSNADKTPVTTQPEKPPEPVQKTRPVEEPPAPPKADILRKAPEKPKTIKEAASQSIDAISDMLKRETDRMTKLRIADVVDREQAQLRASQAGSARNRGLAEYQAKIVGKIRGNIVLPPAINGNPESIFVVAQLPSGEVLSVKLITPSGNQALDTAVERAILKSSPLPKPDDPSLFQREISIKYRPLED